MGDMVEKCAKAIEDAIRGDSEANFVGEWLVPGKTRIDADGVDMRLVAAAVIDALMEPSPQVIADGLAAYELTGISATAIGTAEDHVELIWQAMLSKAKSE